MATYTQPTPAPVAKVKAVGYAGIITTIVPLIVTVLASFGVALPDNISNQAVAVIGAIVTLYAAVQSVVHFLAGYIKKAETK